jgi:hypothetical protein
VLLDGELRERAGGRYGRPDAMDEGFILNIDTLESMAVGLHGELYIAGRSMNQRSAEPYDLFIARIDPARPKP